jgi:uncharacterized LabA/DUF88 family protein
MANQQNSRRHRPQKEVFAFIDNQNLNVTIQNLGWKMDWRKLRRFLSDRYGVTRALMFIGYVPEQEEMYKQLHESGYSIVLKPTYDMSRPRPEESEQKKEDKKPIKGNVDVELVLWAVKEIKKYDQAVVITGDGDFYSLIEYLKDQSKLAKLLTPSGHYSRLFTPYKEYIDRLDQHRRELEYRPRSAPRDRKQP